MRSPATKRRSATTPGSNSNLFHRSGAMTFKDGCENRRINITMLFGERENARAVAA